MQGQQSFEKDSIQLKKIHDEALSNQQAYDVWLTHIAKEIGARLAGSEELDEMIAYTEKELQKLGVDKVWKQEVEVPHWERGDQEEAFIISEGKKQKTDILALGGSAKTPTNGLQAKVIEVQSIEELKELGKSKIEGKIVFFNRPMDATLINTFEAYSKAGDQRFAGPEKAAKLGAVGAIVRSMTLRQDDVPHTGATFFRELAKEDYIPAATISLNGADLLSKTLKENPETEFFFKQNPRHLEPVKSYNVIAEITGSEFPDEYIIVGGHSDSWDVGEGAHDDGAGIVQSMEVLRLFKTLSYKPKRSIRAVLFVNEENGAKGAQKYAEQVKKDKEEHIFAIESDAGGFVPRGFIFDPDTPDHVRKKIMGWKALFAPYDLHSFEKQGSGVDISFLKNDRIVLSGLAPDSQRYFDIHHSDNDVLEAVNPRELQLGAAAMASLIYLVDQHGF